jgi:hypothetical protein
MNLGSKYWRRGDKRERGWRDDGKFGPLAREETPEQMAARRLLIEAEREEAKRRQLQNWGSR